MMMTIINMVNVLVMMVVTNARKSPIQSEYEAMQELEEKVTLTEVPVTPPHL